MVVDLGRGYGRSGVVVVPADERCTAVMNGWDRGDRRGVQQGQRAVDGDQYEDVKRCEFDATRLGPDRGRCGGLGAWFAGGDVEEQRKERAANAQGQAAGAWDKVHGLFRDASPMTCSHWNPTTGELFRVRSSRRQAALVEAFETRLFSEEGWYEVPFLESDDAFALMGDFARELGRGKGRTELLKALEGDKPFRRFREVLQRRPGLARRWKKVADEEAAMRLAVFCLGQGLTIDHPEFRRAVAEIEREWQRTERAEGLIATAGLSLAKGR